MTVAAVVQLARADRSVAATAEQWDANHMQLVTVATTTAGGGLRPVYGLARAPEPLDYDQWATACAAPAGTPHPQWGAFLIASRPGRGSQASRNATSDIAARG